MRAEKFNKLSLDDKFTWITKRLNGQPVGFCNQLIFRDKIVFFLFGRNGKPAISTAEALPKKFRKGIAAKFDQANLICLNHICDGEQGYKERLFVAKFDNSPLKN